MNNCYLHYKKNNLNKVYILILIFLIGFGFYKNGILVYEEFHNIVSLFKPLSFPIISILIFEIFNYIKNKKIEFNDNGLYLLLLSVMIPVNTNLILFTFLNVIFNLLLNLVLDKINLKINYVALFKLILILLLIISNRYNYANELEKVGLYSYDLIDIFFGRGISGVCSSSIFLIIIGYILLSFNFYYKSDIPLISLISYIFIALLFKIMLGKVFILNSLILFSFVFIAPINIFSPARKKERWLYAIVLGILTSIFTYFFNMYDGVTLAIFLSSTINYIKLK